MKIILCCLFSIVNFNGRFTNLVLATKSEQTSRKVIPNEPLLKDYAEGKALNSDYSEININFFEETEKQELLLPSQSVITDPPFLDNNLDIKIQSELSATSEGVVYQSVDTGDESSKGKTQFKNEKANSSNQVYTSLESEKKDYVVHAEPKTQVKSIAEGLLHMEMNESETVPTSSQEEPKKTAPQHEDIPSFSEWTQKQLAEAEKKKSDQNETIDKFTKMRGKFRNKNYASPDCGAKIVAANPESVSSSAVLSPLKDEYMLNYCANRIWFVIELCEAIQAKQLDLANFELFSSSPKHFSVFVSHRFPTRDWSNVGKFTAQDSRDVQTFNLHPHLFGKYVKVELHSHYGKEQFCPVSWVGIYGTSEYEVLAKEDERNSLSEDDEGDQYDEDIFVGHRRDSPKNLFSSATDAVLSIVKKATAPFMKTENNDTELRNVEEPRNSIRVLCISPRYITVCNNCSQNFYDEVFFILSCQYWTLTHLLSNSFVKRVLISTESCMKFGLDFSSLKTGAPFPTNFIKKEGKEVNYLTLMLKNSIVAALCNVLAVLENKVVVNATVEGYLTLKNVTDNKEFCGDVNAYSTDSQSSMFSTFLSRSQTTSQFQFTESSILTDIFQRGEDFSKKIEPTKTLTEDEVKMLPPSISDVMTKVEVRKSIDLSDGHVTPTEMATLGGSKTEVESSTKKELKSAFVESKMVEVQKEPSAEEKSHNTSNHQYSTLDSIISDINAIEKMGDSPTASNPLSASNLPAESIFLRLANRIKVLEINMSLSSTYLEELSKRYRTQFELLSKTLNLTIQKMEEQSKKEEEKERQKEKEILLLRMQLANLTREVSLLVTEKNSWRARVSSISQHILFIFVEILLVWAIFIYRKRSTETKSFSKRLEPPKKTAKKCKRRNSLEGVKGHETPRKKTRRPSDEALEIALSRSHREILKVDKKRKRKKKDSKCSINVIHLKRKKSDSTVSDIAGDQSINLTMEESYIPEIVPDLLSPTAEVEVSNRFAPISKLQYPLDNVNTVAKAFQSLSASPIFVKTALAARNSRFKLASDKKSSQGLSIIVKPEQDLTKKEDQRERKGSNSLKKYMRKFF